MFAIYYKNITEIRGPRRHRHLVKLPLDFIITTTVVFFRQVHKNQRVSWSRARGRTKNTLVYHREHKARAQRVWCTAYTARRSQKPIRTQKTIGYRLQSFCTINNNNTIIFDIDIRAALDRRKLQKPKVLQWQYEVVNNWLPRQGERERKRDRETETY